MGNKMEKMVCMSCGAEFIGKVHGNGYRRKTCSDMCMAIMGRKKMEDNKASGSKSTIDLHRESVAHANEAKVRVKPNKNSVYRRVYRYARAMAKGRPIELWK